MSFEVINFKEIIHYFKTVNHAPNIIILGTAPQYFDPLYDLNPEITHINNRPLEKRPSNYIFIQYYINANLIIWFYKDQIFLHQQFNNTFRLLLNELDLQNYQDNLTLKIVDNNIFNNLQKIFYKLKSASDTTELLHKYTKAVKLLLKTIVQSNQAGYEKILSLPELWAFAPEVISELSQKNVHNDEKYILINNLLPDSKPATLPKKFYLLTPLLNELFKNVWLIFDSIYNLAKHKEIALKTIYQFELIEKQKKELELKIEILKILRHFYPQLQSQLEELEKQLKKLENPACTFKELSKQTKELKNNLPDYNFKEISKKTHTDIVPDGLKQTATNLLQLLNNFREQGDLQAINAIKRFLDFYKHPDKATIIDKTVFQFLVNYSKYRLTVNELTKMDPNLIQKNYLQLRKEIEVQLKNLDKRIENLEEQLISIKNK